MAHYNDLKSYIQAKHGSYLKEMVTAFVNDNHEEDFILLAYCPSVGRKSTIFL